MGLQPPNRQNCFFGKKFTPTEYIPLSNFFYKIWRGEGLPDPTVTPTFTIVALKMWPYGRQNHQNSNFWYKFAPKKKSRGSVGKLEYRCTTRNLPVCNGTIIDRWWLRKDSLTVFSGFINRIADKLQQLRPCQKSRGVLFQTRYATAFSLCAVNEKRRLAQEHRLNLSEFKGNCKWIWSMWQHVNSLEMRR